MSRTFKRLSKENKPRMVAAMVVTLVESVGGYDRFSREFHSFINAGTATAADRSRMMCAITNMTIAAEALKLEAAAAERAALEKARDEQLDRASLDELLREGAPLYRQMGWTVKPPRKSK